MHAENFSVYGIRKMWHAMNREGFHIGRDKTARLMKLAGVSGRRRGRTPVTTISPKAPDHRPDLVQRDFRAQAPGRLWVADITYVRTLSGFAYTAFVVDVFSRKIVGVATRSTMRTDALPMEALEHALTTAGRIHGNQLIHHSDRCNSCINSYLVSFYFPTVESFACEYVYLGRQLEVVESHNHEVILPAISFAIQIAIGVAM